MLLDICFGTRTSWKIMLILSEAPGKAISRKEIQKFTRIGNKALIKFLMTLEKFEIILVEKIGKSYYYKLNMENIFVNHMLELIHAEKKQLNNPNINILGILREFTYELTNIDLDNIQNVILFGSYAKRTYNDNSDIDIAIILKEKDSNDELLITDAIDRINKRFKKEIQPHYYTIKEFDTSSKKSGLAREILKDGIKLM
jgi:uncharacterized protein